MKIPFPISAGDIPQESGANVGGTPAKEPFPIQLPNQRSQEGDNRCHGQPFRLRSSVIPHKISYKSFLEYLLLEQGKQLLPNVCGLFIFCLWVNRCVKCQYKILNTT